MLFLFLLLPYITDYLEGGHFPEKATEWITEIVMTIVISYTIFIIYRQYAKLEKLSLSDHLTGIGNRRLFEMDLNREILRTKRKGSGLILLFFDLDGFKQINDIYGHQHGDQVLIDFACGLSDFIRKGSDSCYRFGGDEFALLMTDIKGQELINIERKIDKRLTKIVYNRLPDGVSASRGLVILKDNEDFNEFLKRADEAMYRAKSERKSFRNKSAKRKVH